jgi:hypothetical protein
MRDIFLSVEIETKKSLTKNITWDLDLSFIIENSTAVNKRVFSWRTGSVLSKDFVVNSELFELLGDMVPHKSPSFYQRYYSLSDDFDVWSFVLGPLFNCCGLLFLSALMNVYKFYLSIKHSLTHFVDQHYS